MEAGRLQFIGSLLVGHDWATSLSLFTFTHWRGKWQPTPVFLPGESQGRRSLVGCRLWVAQSWTRLKWLSSSSSLTFPACSFSAGCLEYFLQRWESAANFICPSVSKLVVLLSQSSSFFFGPFLYLDQPDLSLEPCLFIAYCTSHFCPSVFRLLFPPPPPLWFNNSIAIYFNTRAKGSTLLQILLTSNLASRWDKGTKLWSTKCWNTIQDLNHHWRQ